MISTAAKTMFSVVNDTIDFNLIRKGLFKAKYSDFEVLPALKETIEIFQLEAYSKNLPLTLKFEGPVP